MKNPKGLIVTIILIVAPILWLIIRLNTLSAETTSGDKITQDIYETVAEYEENEPVVDYTTNSISGEYTSGEYKSSNYGNPISKLIENAKIKDDTVIIYEEPSEDANPIGSIKKDVEITAQDYDIGWTWIKFENTAGWVRTENVIKPTEGNSDSLQSAIGKTGKVITDVLNLRPNPNTVEDPIDQLSINDTFKILDEDGTGNWYNIQYGTKNGWIKYNSQWVQIEY